MKLLSLVVAFSLAMTIAAFAGTRVEFDPDYPGNSSDGRHLDVGLQNVKLGVFYFRKVFGRWPQSWAEVRSAGIFQTDIPGYDMQPLNPDDPAPSDFGDVYYEPPSSPGGNPVFHSVANIGGMSIQHWVANGYSRTYEESFRDYDNDLRRLGVADFSYSDYLEDIPLLKQFAILGIMEAEISQFRDVKGHLPVNIEEFLSSGFSPVDTNSINPVTGVPFKFDGSVGDVTYEVLENGTFRLRHVSAEPEERGFTY